MKNLFLFIFLFLVFSANAEVKLISFYFDSETDSLTMESTKRMEEILKKQEVNEFQIIEMNAYGRSINISCKYSETILRFFKIKEESVNYNCLGNKRELLSFKPAGWNRVDVYYFLGELIEPFRPIVIKRQEKEKVEQNDISETIIEEPETKIIENTPIVLPIKFEGGTANILSSSHTYLEELYNLLASNPQYRVEIKGHVCCENNMRMSKKRAKVVQQFLIKKGIDSSRLSYEGYSNKSPIVFPERSEKDRAKNRRVEVVFIKL